MHLRLSYGLHVAGEVINFHFAFTLLLLQASAWLAEGCLFAPPAPPHCRPASCGGRQWWPRAAGWTLPGLAAASGTQSHASCSSRSEQRSRRRPPQASHWSPQVPWRDQLSASRPWREQYAQPRFPPPVPQCGPKKWKIMHLQLNSFQTFEKRICFALIGFHFIHEAL